MMDNLLKEIKALMGTSGYSIEDIKLVVDSFNNFYSYISRNKLEEEFSNCISSFKLEVAKKIKNKRNGNNIAGVFDFNGTSLASKFIKSCVEIRVQNVLNGFLKSSELYYKMACRSEDVDVVRVLAQLDLDGISVDKSVELTAPTTIVSFSTELSLKTLYSVKNYDSIVKNIYSDVTRFENGIYPNEYLFNNRLSLIDKVSRNWVRLEPSNEPIIKDVMNDVRDLFTSSNRPVNLPDDDKDGNVKINGHTLYRVFYNLPDEFQTMIKYQIVTAFSRSESFSLDDKVVSAIDYFLMEFGIDTTLDNIDSTKQMVINSNNFDKMRYLIDLLGSEELLFSMAFASSSYKVAKHEVEGRCFSTLKSSTYVDKDLCYTEELERLISSDADKGNLLEYISNNGELLAVAKTLTPQDLYILIDMFSLDEIIWMKDSCKETDSCSFKEMMHYCVFFKKYLNNYEFKYDEKKYKNINKLFYAIRTTNNLAMLGSQISQWFAEINVYSLTQEEFEILKIFDKEYIFNSLSYKDRVLYKKCNERGVPFKIYYASSAYASTIAKNIDNPSIDSADFEGEIDSIINQGFNRVLIVNDENLNQLRENEIVYDILCREFGSYENVPNVLKGLPVGDIQALLNYCEERGISIKQQAQELMGSSCFFCKSSYILRNVNNKTDRYKVRFPSSYGNAFEMAYDDFALFKGSFIIGNNVELIRKGPFQCKNFESLSLIQPLCTVRYFELDVDINRPTDKDLLERLLDRGFDFMSATFLQKNCTQEEIDSFMEFIDRFGIPLEVLTAVVSRKISMDSLVEKVYFFTSRGCRLDDIPAYYYLRSEITTDVFNDLFRILDGVYSKENIPNALLTMKTNKVEILLGRLKEEKISVYNFMTFMPVGGNAYLDKIDDYIKVYKQVKIIKIDSGMELKNFDLVVSDYNQIKKMLGLEQDDAGLLEASLYKGYSDMVRIVKYCMEESVPFMYEYFYFSEEFLSDNLMHVYTVVDSLRKMGIKMNYDNALNLMKNMGYSVNKVQIESGKPKRVA